MTEETAKRRLIPLTDWPNHHAYPPLGQLRALVFNAKTNGFEHCIRRVGKRILIDETEYFRWIDRQKFNQEIA
jgi:hypothetical protein